MEYQIKGFGLEVVGKCNASCEFCSWGHNKDVVHTNVFTGEEVRRSTGKISTELVDKIFEVHEPGAVIFTGLSEPFLAPDRVFYVADKLEERGGAFAVYTNGTLLKEEYVRKLFTYKGFQSLHVSLNATTNETRKQVMNLELDKAEENLKRLLEIRKEVGREDSTHIGCVMMLTNNNRKEEHTFRVRWNNVFNNYKNCNAPGVFLTTNWNGEAPMPWIKTGGVQYCNQWDIKSPTISVDGELYLCCYSTRYTFGSCLDPEAVKKWMEKKELFDVSRENGKHVPPKHLCGECTGWKNVSWA